MSCSGDPYIASGNWVPQPAQNFAPASLDVPQLAQYTRCYRRPKPIVFAIFNTNSHSMQNLAEEIIRIVNKEWKIEGDTAITDERGKQPQESHKRPAASPLPTNSIFHQQQSHSQS